MECFWHDSGRANLPERHAEVVTALGCQVHQCQEPAGTWVAVCWSRERDSSRQCRPTPLLQRRLEDHYEGVRLNRISNTFRVE
jgi:hypothetical protein